LDKKQRRGAFLKKSAQKTFAPQDNVFLTSNAYRDAGNRLDPEETNCIWR